MASFSCDILKLILWPIQLEFLCFIQSTDGFISGDFHNACQDEQDSVAVD